MGQLEHRRSTERCQAELEAPRAQTGQRGPRTPVDADPGRSPNLTTGTDQRSAAFRRTSRRAAPVGGNHFQQEEGDSLERRANLKLPRPNKKNSGALTRHWKTNLYCLNPHFRGASGGEKLDSASSCRGDRPELFGRQAAAPLRAAAVRCAGKRPNFYPKLALRRWLGTLVLLLG